MQSVVEKILAEAKKEAEAIKAKYEDEIARIKQEYEVRIAQAEESLKKELERKKNEEIMRAIARERLEQNKKLTTEMQKYIDDVLQKAIKGLPEHKGYLNFLKELIKSSGVKEGELYLSKGDIVKYQSQLEKFLKQEGLNFTIKNDEGITGGVVIKKGNITFLGSIDVITETMREELRMRIARILGFLHNID